MSSFPYRPRLTKAEVETFHQTIALDGKFGIYDEHGKLFRALSDHIKELEKPQPKPIEGVVHGPGVAKIAAEVKANRVRWGQPHDRGHSRADWLSLINEYLGKASRESREGTPRQYLYFLSAVGALAAAAIEADPATAVAEGVKAFSNGNVKISDPYF